MTPKSNRGGIAARLRGFLQRGARDERGVAAVFFAVSLLLLVPLTLGLVDVYMSTTQRGQLQDALDSATLYVARSTETDAAKIKTMGYGVLMANLKLMSGQTVAAYDFQLVDGRKVVSSASITPPGFSPAIWDQQNLKATSEVTRNSVNLEVAIILDTTGSMSGQMSNLKQAAKDLVDIVVNDVQTPYYSKAALVPYAVGVNMGSYANAARGAPRSATAITGMTKTNPIVVTSNGHGLANGEAVYITGVNGMTQVNNKEYIVANRAPNTFELKTSPTDSTPPANINGTSGYSTYTSGGTAQCRGYGCQDQRFTDAGGSTRRLFTMTACATERVGTDAYTDAAPSSSPVSAHYQATSSIGSNTTCKSGAIIPLTSTKSTLKTAIDGLVSDGYTAGHIGLGWGWYAISPEWKNLWTGDSEPAAYNEPETVKVAILMTDGAFNTMYYQGVNAKNGSGGTADRINVNATNGDPFAQALKLCTNMKAKGIVIYTVGFNVSSDTSVVKLLQDCATPTDSKTDYSYLPSSGTDLKDAFKAIGQDISRLRISR